MLPLDEWYAKYGAPAVNTTKVHTMEEFRSPIDGSRIGCPSALREHNKKHGVTNISDYGENNGAAYFENKAKQRSEVLQCRDRDTRRQRRQVINQALGRHGI